MNNNTNKQQLNKKYNSGCKVNYPTLRSSYYQSFIKTLIRDSNGYKCPCGQWVYKYSWKHTTKKQAFDSHMSKCCYRFLDSKIMKKFIDNLVSSFFIMSPPISSTKLTQKKYDDLSKEVSK